MDSMFRPAALALVMGLLLGGCVSSRNPLAGVPKEVQDEAGRRVSVVPAPVSTLEFKELGESRRFEVLRGLIQRTWQAECTPTDAKLRGYSPNGSSLWQVRCAGGSLAYDYFVSIPERRAVGARVLSCYAPTPGRTVCSIVSRPS